MEWQVREAESSLSWWWRADGHFVLAGRHFIRSDAADAMIWTDLDARSNLVHEAPDGDRGLSNTEGRFARLPHAQRRGRKLRPPSGLLTSPPTRIIAASAASTCGSSRRPWRKRAASAVGIPRRLPGHRRI